MTRMTNFANFDNPPPIFYEHPEWPVGTDLDVSEQLAIQLLDNEPDRYALAKGETDPRTPAEDAAKEEDKPAEEAPPAHAAHRGAATEAAPKE